MITRLIWTIWTPMSSVPKKADKLNLSLKNYELTHWVLVMLTSWHHRLRWWLVAWWQQAITWTNVILSSARSSDNHLSALLQEIHQPLATKISLRITWLEFHSNPPGSRKLSEQHFIQSKLRSSLSKKPWSIVVIVCTGCLGSLKTEEFPSEACVSFGRAGNNYLMAGTKNIKSYFMYDHYSCVTWASQCLKSHSKWLLDWYIVLIFVFDQSIEARCWVKNEDAVGTMQTSDAPTTSEWSTILLPNKVQLI